MHMSENLISAAAFSGMILIVFPSVSVHATTKDSENVEFYY